MSKSSAYLQYAVYSLLGFLVVASGYLGYTLYELRQTHQSLVDTHNETVTEHESYVATTTTAINQKDDLIARLAEELNLTVEDLREEKERNDEFEDQIADLAGTVGVLDKLSKTDEELLQKYSKVYFLNEHYVPESLREIDDEWKYNEDKNLKLHSKVMPFFEDMLEAAKDDGIDLWVVSAYRSFEYQSQLKGAYTVTYGSGANTFSADQGYSEHQLGTTVDFTTNGLGGGLNGFQNTPAYEWLQDNAHKYGFTLSYPPNNQFYVFEPWHWRFVGRDLADDLHDDNDHFYDLDQRKIDEYLISIFD